MTRRRRLRGDETVAWDAHAEMASVEDAGTGDREKKKEEGRRPIQKRFRVTPARCGSRRSVRVPINAHRRLAMKPTDGRSPQSDSARAVP